MKVSSTHHIHRTSQIIITHAEVHKDIWTKSLYESWTVVDEYFSSRTSKFWKKKTKTEFTKQPHLRKSIAENEGGYILD